MRGKILILIISLLLFSQAKAQYSGGDGNQSTPYQIKYAKDLIELSNQVMSGVQYSGKYFTLMNDIDFVAKDSTGKIVSDSSTYFTPIGGWDSPSTNSISRYFSGNFDGQNYSIKNILIDSSQNSYIGLFGYTNSATISNLTVAGTFLSLTGSYVGGLSGFSSNTNFNNCRAIVSVGGVSNIGGLVGYSNNNSIITNCSSSSSVKIVKKASLGNLGGLIGYSENTNIINSHSDGSVAGIGLILDEYGIPIDYENAESNIGGLVGSFNGGVINNSYSESEVIGYSERVIYEVTWAMVGVQKVGGLVGNLIGATVRNSYSMGNASGDTYVGGFLGYSTASYIDSCYSYSLTKGNYIVGGFAGNLDGATANYCFAKGNVENVDELHLGVAMNKVKGGFIGYSLSSGYFYNCYSRGNVYGYDMIGGFVGDVNGSPGSKYNYATGIAISTGGTASQNFGGFYGGIADPSKEDNYYTQYPKEDLGDGILVDFSFGGYGGQYMGDLTGSILDSLVVNEPLTWKSDGTIFGQINGGYPVLDWQNTDTVDPYIVMPGEVLEVPSNYSGSFPSLVVVKEGGSFINHTNTPQDGVVERMLISNEWNLVSSAVGKTNYMFLSLDNSFYKINSNQMEIAALNYDYENNKWASKYLYKTKEFPIMNGSFAFPVLENHKNHPKTTVYQKGILYNKDTVVDFTNTSIEKWVAIGNPYPGIMSVDAFIQANSSKIQGGDLIWTFNTEDYFDTEATFFPAGEWVPCIQGTTSTKTIKAMEGFMLTMPNDSTTCGFIFNKNQLLGATPQTKKIHREILPIIKLKVQANKITKEAFFRINQNATNNFDKYDSYAMISQNKNTVTPYLILDDKEIIKNEFKSLPYTVKMNLNSNIENNKTKISISNLPDNLQVILTDTLGNIEKDITDSIYETILSKGNNSSRFTLTFKEKTSSNICPIKYIDDIEVKFWNVNRDINIEGRDIQYLEIIDILGRTVYTKSISAEKYTKQLNNLPVGTYNAKIKTKKGSKVFKFVVSK